MYRTDYLARQTDFEKNVQPLIFYNVTIKNVGEVKPQSYTFWNKLVCLLALEPPTIYFVGNVVVNTLIQNLTTLNVVVHIKNMNACKHHPTSEDSGNANFNTDPLKMLG
uniref:Uncharacterized protein n=1 Tax=Lepeophtheirus salmonis TaxID=72036 RepID=A0A0K2TTL2_LEPSM